jgi:hypothetical protein
VVTDNVCVRKRLNAPRLSGPVRVVLVVTLVLASLPGCDGHPTDPATGPTTPQAGPPVERDQLAGLAAAAKDKRYVATYTLTGGGRPDRTVTVAVATDGSWVVGVPAGALSGLADIAMFHNGTGLFQCTLGAAAGTAGRRPDLEPITAGCVAAPTLPTADDPLVHHIFTDWIDALVDRNTALSVAYASPLPGSTGACFSVESTSAALAPPVEPGVYCYESDGVLTAARVTFGTLTLVGGAGGAPPSVTMPGSLVNRALVPVTAPPPPASTAP